LFDWYGTAMKQAGFSRLIRIVHPEYYVRPASAADRVTETIMRVDPLLDLWRPDTPRRKDLVAMAQVDPQDAASWRQFLERIFALAERGGALGTKQLQGYRRSLRYEVRGDGEVRRWTGDLTPDEVTVFQDWVMHECSKLAHERGWPHQVHVGTHNLSQSSPLPLELLGRRYPRMKIVMIHCWPFFAEAGWLAKQLPNLYIDTCWLPVLNPSFFRQAMEQWWNYVPLHKITCGHDSTTVEMATGSSLYTREILAELGGEQLRRHNLTRTEVLSAIGGFLHGNAEALYGPKPTAAHKR
jgi:predicted TIM-barrel fold metal-dependent hydrolase